MKGKAALATFLLLLIAVGYSAAQWRFPGDAAPPDDFTPPPQVSQRSETLPPFKRIRLYGQSQLVVELGDKQEVKIVAAPQDLPVLSAWVEGDTLIVSEKEHSWTSPQQAVVYVTARRMDAICAYGSGAVSFLNKDEGPLELLLNGSGDTTVAGFADMLNVTMKGSGNLDAFRLTVGETNLQLGGSGNVTLGNIGGALTLQSNGTGTVTARAVRVRWVNVALNGAGKVLLAGKAKQAAITVESSGDVDGRKLQAEIAMVRLNGSGSVSLGVKKALTATVSGSGNVTYFGNPPQLVCKTNGSGQILRGDQ